MTRLESGAATDVGRIRQNNEDAAVTADGLWAVADGMGGHKGGEVASAVAVEILQQAFRGHDHTEQALVDATEAANAAVHAAATDDPDLFGMGTTLVAIAQTDDDELAYVNVGDSRIYLLRDGELQRLTSDHSLVEELVREGSLTPEEAKVHPKRNIVTRALGIEPRVEVDSATITPYTGDRYLLCSDGLFDEIDEDRIASVLRRLADAGEAARELVRLAVEHGGRDNVTVVVVDVIDDDGRSAAASTKVKPTTGALDLAGFTAPVAEEAEVARPPATAEP
ncbi:MAG: Stp1/IreP family PP2C-type Ser/Thr phosphatase, partial [Acidimicrobiales bacterium]